jgi:hypothetical protein
MNLTLEIPDDIAPRLTAGGRDLSRAALEVIAAEAYREDRITKPELQRLLGIATSYQAWSEALQSGPKSRQPNTPFLGQLRRRPKAPIQPRTSLFLWCGEGDLFSCTRLKTGKLYITRRPENSESSRSTRLSHTASHTGPKTSLGGLR